MHNNELITERYSLAIERIREISSNADTKTCYKDYFEKTAAFIVMMDGVLKENLDDDKYDINELKQKNRRLYEDILPENYDKSYANPAYAVCAMGELNGRLLSFLYTEVRSMITYAYELNIFFMTITAELFLQVYCMYEGEEEPKYHDVRECVYWFVSDYSEEFMADRVVKQLIPEESFATDIVMNSDLNDIKYLYSYGEYITDNEIGVSRFLADMPQEKIDAMARTYTEGYRMGFVLGNKDLSKKKTVDIRYCIGFERIVRAAILNFRQMGLEPVIYRYAVNAVNKKMSKIGFFGTSANRQYEYDHKNDYALYIDRDYNERRLGVLKSVYEELKSQASLYAGPAVMEVFGEEGFEPVSKPECIQVEPHQQTLVTDYSLQAGQIVNEYIKGEERSFTIIAYPIPEIGADFEAIFDETVKINTLDYELYKEIQQTIIDTLDEGKQVHIKGNNGNSTDLYVSLIDLIDHEKQTKFENCLADVNIPLGEIFTSPRLTGTTGILNVSQVFLGELMYRNLRVEFRDGMVTDYDCDNFQTTEENKKFIKQNLLHNHDTLPMGEFAIGTNTVAYMMALKYKILDKLPILIAEKMGPHFAVGDTCYSHAEDVKVFNPNGKEIFARDNEITAELRKTDPSKAYFGCHTDITIPYNELGLIEVIKEDGSNVIIIKDGRFVLNGTEKLNEPFGFAID